MSRITVGSKTARSAAVVLTAGLAVAACGSSSTTPATGASTTAPAGSATTAQVLPVTKNPIVNNSTAQTLKIVKMLVDNNVDAAGQTVSDHLEIALQNTGSTPLSGVEIYYTLTDTVSKAAESYYEKLPVSFTIPAGGQRVVHFDNTGLPDHFPISKFSLYSTSKNALDVSVVVSAQGAAIQTKTVNKSASTGETPGQ